MGSVSTWIGVTAGSTLRISIKGKKNTDKDFSATARVVPSTGAESLIPDHKLVPGPHSLKTREGVSYAVRIAVLFIGAGAQRAVVTAELVDHKGAPKANVDGDLPYEFEVSGKKGQDPRRCTLTLQRASQGAPHV